MLNSYHPIKRWRDYPSVCHVCMTQWEPITLISKFEDKICELSEFSLRPANDIAVNCCIFTDSIVLTAYCLLSPGGVPARWPTFSILPNWTRWRAAHSMTSCSIPSSLSCWPTLVTRCWTSLTTTVSGIVMLLCVAYWFRSDSNKHSSALYLKDNAI